MNRPSAHIPRWLRPQTALFLLLLVACPGPALAQKTAAPPAMVTPPAAPAPPAPATLPPPALTQKEMLAQDARLDRPISLDVISVPLNEVLQKESLDKSTDKMEDGHRFLLTAATDCADLKLQVRLNNRPLRTLMTALAEMVPGVWTRTPHGYQLAMAKQAADARAEWWRLFLGEREKSLALQRQAVLAAMETKAHRRQAGDPDPEQSDRAVEEDMANQHDFFYSLPESLKQQIAANMDEGGFYDMKDMAYSNIGEQSGTFGWLSQMSPQTQERFKQAMQAGVDRLAQAPPDLQKYAVQARKDVAAFDPNRVYFWFVNGGMGVIATPINSPPGANQVLGLQAPRIIATSVLSLDQTQLVDEVYGSGDTSPGWKHEANKILDMGDAATPELMLMVYHVYGMGRAAGVEAACGLPALPRLAQHPAQTDSRGPARLAAQNQPGGAD